MRLLRYTINTTLDGCVDHRLGVPDPELHQYSADTLARADALIFGRITYGMMEAGWRALGETGVRPEGRPDWTVPFAKVIHAKPKYVVSRTLKSVDWNGAQLIRGDIVEAVRRLKEEPGKELYVGGVTLPLALAEHDLIDEYEFWVQPRIAGHGPTLLSGLTQVRELTLVARREFVSGTMALTYRPKR